MFACFSIEDQHAEGNQMIRQVNDAAQFQINFPHVPIANHRFATNLSKEDWERSSGKLVLEANAGDHSMIIQFLKTTLPDFTENDFEYVLDSPNYVPQNRLLIRQGSEILGHVRMENRTIKIGSAEIHTVDLHEASVFPELVNTSCERALLAAARQHATRRGASILTRNANSGNISKTGWATISTGKHVAMCAHDLLGRIEAFQEETPATRGLKNNYSVRPWRYIERSEVMRIYEKATADRDGARERDDEYWQWLLARRGFDRAYVAVDKREAADAQIVGYAFVRNNQIAELATDSSHPHSALCLLRRIALDAVELGIHSLVFLASSLPQPLAIPLEGTFASKEHQRSLYATTLSIEQLANQTSSELFQIARREGLSIGTKLGVQCGNEVITLKMQRNRLNIQRGLKCEPTISMSPGDATKLFFGQLDALEAFESSRIVATSRLAEVLAASLFAKREGISRMPLDDLRSR